ncbi:hypothetical protein QYE76_062313 [Lolium multiflorum]|uniref:Uncharacterized protein n=1 Tax=Lolium multiflorum TaxID=4521 RepID=A0AAD8W621_LOLMU|nr:hypothetical protein QYE76_062313 [Lolium multiflorum]
MVKKKIPSAAARSSSVLAKEVAPNAPPPAPAPPAPPSSTAKPGDWTASTVTKRDEKRSRSLGLISSDEGNVIFPAVEETRASPKKRSIGGFADEDDLLDFDDTFIEPPPKKARSDAVSPAAAASEASAPKAAPVAQASTASSLSKGKDAPAAAAAPSPDLRGVISSLEAFASQFTSLEADKIRLQEEARSSSSKLDGAIKKAAVARQEVDSLKEELNKLKERLKEEEARAAEKDELLRQSALALLEAADIPATALDKVPSNSPANGVLTVLAAHQLTRGLLDKGKGALARMHSMILPKATQEKTLGQLIDAFAIDTKEVIEDRIAQMEKDLRSTYALAAIINKKSETAADVERYALTELHKATESLNFPPTLLALMSEFGTARKIRDLVRKFLQEPSLRLLLYLRVILRQVYSIANVTGELEALYPKVLLPANIIVDRLERDSKVPEEKETPQV